VLEPTEREIATYRANRTQGSRAVGGHLLLTNQRVCFYPHKLDDATGGKAWECRLASISQVGLAPLGFNPFNGSLRRRVQIECADATEYFVMSKPSDVIAAIKNAVAAIRPTR
jgi:hypothetical protein